MDKIVHLDEADILHYRFVVLSGTTCGDTTGVFSTTNTLTRPMVHSFKLAANNTGFGVTLRSVLTTYSAEYSVSIPSSRGSNQSERHPNLQNLLPRLAQHHCNQLL